MPRVRLHPIRSPHLLALGLLLAVAGPAWAAEPYLRPGQVDLAHILPTPAPPGSQTLNMEVQEVLQAQGARTPQRAAQAAEDAVETVYVMFGKVMGTAFVPGNLPLATKLFERVGATEGALLDPVKKLFGRTRPYVINPNIKPVVPPSTSGSYPSGHATQVTLVAAVLASMVPERSADIWPRAQDYAESRLWGGVHVLSDVEGGYRAGSAIAAVLMNDAAFKAEYGPARAEMRKALGLPE